MVEPTKMSERTHYNSNKEITVDVPPRSGKHIPVFGHIDIMFKSKDGKK